MFLPRLEHALRPEMPQYHDATTTTHEHIPEIYSPQHAHSLLQQPHTTYYHQNPLGLFVDFPSPMDITADAPPPPPPPPRQVEGYTIEGGWQPDGFGGLRYQEHGRVEDVGGSSHHIKNGVSDSERDSITPRDYDGPITITRPLPSSVTPPPAPNFRAQRIEIPEHDLMGTHASATGLNRDAMPYPRLSSLDPSREGKPPVEHRPPPSLSAPPLKSVDPNLPEMLPYQTLSYANSNPSEAQKTPAEQLPPSPGEIHPPKIARSRQPETHLPARTRPTRPPPLSLPGASPRELDDREESSVLQSNLRLVETAVGSLDSISWICQNIPSMEDIRPQLAVDMCGRIRATLSALTVTLNRRSRVTQEHWKLRSQTWHQKYSTRLLSLRRTLQRLFSLEDRLKGSSPRLKTVNKALKRLREFEFKLSDLNIRFNRLFDRLRMRQLHAMLVESISEEQRMRRSDFPTREAYNNKRTEGKAMRARLRRDYFVYHTGRRLSLVT